LRHDPNFLRKYNLVKITNANKVMIATPDHYKGMNSAQARLRAKELTQTAALTGQYQLLSQHLNQLTVIISGDQ
ncbi:hypothetical protein, partial [Erwinia tracheiphila]|uniref:hypothetical protein n=1 Tax=Erwinia tracheiphila TaxID=65700 RepID=UPI001E45F4F2